MRALWFLGLLAVATACPASKGDGGSTGDAGTTGAATSSGGTLQPTGGGGTGVEGAQCDPYAQDCPDGFKCQPPPPIPPGMPAQCVPVPKDPIGINEQCAVGPDSTDECDLGLICIPQNLDEMIGICLAICGGSADAPVCPDGTVCISTLDPFVICFDLCNPLSDPCLDGFTCAPPVEGWEFFCASSLPNPGGPGDPCMNPSQCQPYTTCVDASAVPGCTELHCCSEYCDLSDPSFACAFADQGQECQPFAADPPPGFENVGVCALPG